MTCSRSGAEAAIAPVTSRLVGPQAAARRPRQAMPLTVSNLREATS